MRIYTIGDLHLSLAPGCHKPMDIFGERWINHTERIGENWRRLVKDEDTVVVPGDISWGLKLEEAAYDLEWIDQLPGRKILLKGNHELWWNGITRLNSMYESITFLQNDSLQVGDRWICGSRGWITPDNDEFKESDLKVYKRELLRLEASLKSVPEGGKIIGFLHFPPVADSRNYSGFMELFERYKVKEVYYGHLHGNEAFKKAMEGEYYGVEYRLVSADYLNCKPALIWED